MADNDPFNLQRFVAAQADVFGQVEAELRAGRKRSHWIWFIFPQLAGLGSSTMAQFYALESLDEARAYLAHPVLGPRLRACVGWVMAVEGRGLAEIFGAPDDAKFRSSMTLFELAAPSLELAAPDDLELAAPDDGVFRAALTKFCHGEADPRTLELLARR